MDSIVKIRVEDLNFRYGSRTVLRHVNTVFYEHALIAVVGPSGCGKSTFLMTLNRLWEEIPSAHAEGRVWIRLDGREQLVSAPSFSVTELRRKIGMVFQTPNPLPMSIYKNVAFPLKIMGEKEKHTEADRVENALRLAFLWNEVKDRLHEDARRLSGGQQQRLCIARALAAQPEVLLLDEPTSSLDGRAAAIIEELLVSLKGRCTLIVVSHYLEQVRRVADHVYEVKEETLRPLS